VCFGFLEPHDVRRFKDSEVDVIVLVQDVNRSQRKWCSLLPASLDFEVRAQVFVHRNFSGLLHKPFRRAQSTSLPFIRTCAASIHDRCDYISSNFQSRLLTIWESHFVKQPTTQASPQDGYIPSTAPSQYILCEVLHS